MIEAILQGIASVAQSILDGIMSGLSWVAQQAYDLLLWLWGLVRSLAGDAFGVFAKLAKSQIQHVGLWLKEHFTPVIDSFKSKLDEMGYTEQLDSTIQAATDLQELLSPWGWVLPIGPILAIGLAAIFVVALVWVIRWAIGLIPGVNG